MERLEALDAWPGRTHGDRDFTREPASSDASFRRYFRVASGDETWVAMYAPPEREDCRPFVKVTGLMREAGLHVPEIAAQDFLQGFLLLSDLGRRTYLQAFDGTNEAALFRDATRALVDWQAASREGELAPYDVALLRRELALFPDWYVERHLGVALEAAERASLEEVFRRILERNLSEPRVFVHRDFMPRNLMGS